MDEELEKVKKQDLETLQYVRTLREENRRLKSKFTKMTNLLESMDKEYEGLKERYGEMEKIRKDFDKQVAIEVALKTHEIATGFLKFTESIEKIVSGLNQRRGD